MKVTSPVSRRRAAELVAELAVLCARRGSSVCGSAAWCGFHESARDGLRWLCLGGHGPLTGEASTRPVPARAVTAELAVARMLIGGPPSRHRDYARGLAQSLLWAHTATATRPDDCACTAAPALGPGPQPHEHRPPRTAPGDPTTAPAGGVPAARGSRDPAAGLIL